MAGHSYSKEAHSRAVGKYIKENYDRVTLQISKSSGLKEEITQHIANTGKYASLKEFFITAAKTQMELDKQESTQ